MTIKHTLPSHPFALPLRELFGELRSYLAQDVSWFHFWGKICLHLKYLTVAERLIVRDYLQEIVSEKWPIRHVNAPTTTYEVERVCKGEMLQLASQFKCNATSALEVLSKYVPCPNHLLYIIPPREFRTHQLRAFEHISHLYLKQPSNPTRCSPEDCTFLKTLDCSNVGVVWVDDLSFWEMAAQNPTVKELNADTKTNLRQRFAYV